MVSTDYDDYALAWGCTDTRLSDDGVCSSPHFWLWGRDTSIKEESETAARALYEGLCIQDDKIVITDHGRGGYTL